MDIKLRARLSAYAKVDSLKCVECDMDPVTNDEINTLFGEPPAEGTLPPITDPHTVTYSEIDSLFK